MTILAAAIAFWLTAWFINTRLARGPDTTLINLLIPFLFGAALLALWEGICRGFEVPTVLLPPPSMIWERITNSVPTLWADFKQTYLKAVIAGYVMGCGAGLWFGFDWQSKAAVVVIMTFFPMLVNTVAGLTAASHIEKDMMRTYAASYWQTLFKLRLPAAMPFIFNALKINSTLALIGAIVAEFFGTPIVGMGFRISTEVGRMNVDMVWAEIFVAALAGSLSYGLIALLERKITFWHPSMRPSR